MLTIKTKPADRIYGMGLLLVIVSFALFCWPAAVPNVGSDSMLLFSVHFGAVVIYFSILLFSGRLRRGREGIHVMMIFLILFLISAYALNREMSVFEKSVPWFMGLLIISCLNILLFGCFKSLPHWARYVICFIAGISMIFFSYLALYLVPLYVLGIIGSFVLGISLNAFVPLLFCIYIIVLIRKAALLSPKCKLAFRAGAGITALLIIIFIVNWCILVAAINRTYRQSTVRGDSDLPSWVRVAQQIPHSWTGERILKTGLVYSVADLNGSNWFWSMPSRNFGEERKHDPLVMMGSFFSGRISIPEEKRIKILEAMYDSRHQAQERLWSGNDLETEYINTDILIWPDLRLAYTELNVTVSNFENHSSRQWQEEAIYTFHLPQGSVVTSLSLWIEGKESKGILTTKAKADSAYKTIVGVESRDPSVIHWQEGNTVSVRVFPVLSGESRMFKVGITSPLNYNNNKLNYEPIYFDGPLAGRAEEEISVTFMQQPPAVNMPPSFVKADTGKYSRSGSYTTDWQLSFDAPPLRSNVFSFNGRSYSIRPWGKYREPVVLSAIYLDINAAWSQEECDKVFECVKGKPVWVAGSSDGMEQVTTGNKDLLFNRLRKKHFSLFPFYKINNTESLVISKSGPSSPSIDDLKDSPFLKNMQRYYENGPAIKLYNLGTELSPYLRSLKEFRAFRYEHGDLNALKQLLLSGSFALDIENDQQIVAENAGISIVQTPDSLPSNAPDHIMRLFAYNHILKKSGTRLLSGTVLENELVKEAEEAYVVSPVSSLVVLETREDYDRFDIKNSKNSLENASLKSKGAVPEPHEWALIIIVLLTVLYARLRPSFLSIRK